MCAQSTKQKLKVELIPRDSIRDGLDKKIALVERKIQDEKKKCALVFVCFRLSLPFSRHTSDHHFYPMFSEPCFKNYPDRVRKDLNALQKAYQDAEASLMKITGEVKYSERRISEQADLLKKHAKECVRMADISYLRVCGVIFIVYFVFPVSFQRVLPLRQVENVSRNDFQRNKPRIQPIAVEARPPRRSSV